jgi:hypothetical protein
MPRFHLAIRAEFLASAEVFAEASGHGSRRVLARERCEEQEEASRQSEAGLPGALAQMRAACGGVVCGHCSAGVMAQSFCAKEGCRLLLPARRSCWVE